MIYNIIVIILSVAVAILVEKIIYKENFDIKNKIIWFELIVLVSGFLVRLISISEFPNALNVDEASAGYEAYSILNYGIDRHGNFLPVFLQAWGGGQNALLTYMAIPFVKILGLNTLAIRLPMAIIGCISIIVIFALLKRISDGKLADIGLLFFVICPWNIMKSRWGLESNLFPDLILLFSYMLIRGLQDKKKLWYYLAFVVSGLSAYAYGTSYFFLPCFIIPLLIVLIIKKEINIIQALISIAITGIVAMPIILCVIINQFDLNQINLPFCTIPKLEIQRYENMASIFSGDFWGASKSNIENSINILINQYDGLPWNAIQTQGIIYKFSVIFTIVGIVVSIVKKDKYKYDYIFKVWIIAAVLLMIICDPNINRINIIWIPIIYYSIIGIGYVIEEKKLLEITLLFIYLISFVTFLIDYSKEDASEYFTFVPNMDRVVNCINEEQYKGKEIYITSSIKEPYIYVLFYSKYNTNDYVDTVKYTDITQEFQNVESFGRYHFGRINEIKKGNLYVIKSDELDNYQLDEEIWQVKNTNEYSIIYEK